MVIVIVTHPKTANSCRKRAHPSKADWHVYQRQKVVIPNAAKCVRSIHSNISDIKGVNCSHILRLTVKW